MRISVAIFIAAAGLVAAQECPGKTIFDTCLSQLKGRLSSCDPNDWICQCARQRDILTCYNNCPGLPEESTEKSTETQYCNAAAQQSSISEAAAATETTLNTRAATTSAPDATTTAEDESATSTASEAAETPTSTGAAGTVIVAPVGGVLAVALAFAGML